MKNWYLIDSPSLSSGYENQVFNEYKDDALREILESEASVTVKVLYHDLSECGVIRCLLQGNASDTYDGALDRTAVFPIGFVKAGMYVVFEDDYWLVVSRPSTNKFYDKVQLKLCQYKLRWQNAHGKIISRYVHLTKASSGIGQQNDKIMTLLNYDYEIFTPWDKETLALEGKRVFIDPRHKNPFKVFEFTKADDVPYWYGDRGGVIQLCANRVELNTVTDNVDLKICDYVDLCKPEPEPSDSIVSYINGNLQVIYNYHQHYYVEFADGNGVELSPDKVNYEWNIVSEVATDIHVLKRGPNLEIWVDNHALVGKELTIQVLVNGEVNSEFTTVIVDAI